MNRPIQQLQLEAKMGNDFGDVHETRAPNGFAAEIAVHGPPHRTRVKGDARISHQLALLVLIVSRA